MSALPQKRPAARDGTVVYSVDVDWRISVFGWVCMESLARTDILGRDDAQRKTQVKEAWIRFADGQVTNID